MDELGRLLGGSGKAKLFWSMIREGRDVFGSDSLLSAKAQDHLHSTFSNFNGDAFDAQMGNIISTKVSTETVSSCGGRKQLHTLPDRLEVESVIIPRKFRLNGTLSDFLHTLLIILYPTFHPSLSPLNPHNCR